MRNVVRKEEEEIGGGRGHHGLLDSGVPCAEC